MSKQKRFKKVVVYPDDLKEIEQIIGGTIIIASMIVGLVLSVIGPDVFVVSMVIGAVVAVVCVALLNLNYGETYWVEVKE